MKTAAFVLSLFFILTCLGNRASLRTTPQPFTSQPMAFARPVPTPAICVGLLGDSIQITKLGLGRQRLGSNRLNIEMTISNTSGRDLNNIAWGITSDDGQANTGYVNIPACGSVDVALSWPTQAGAHTFTGDIDPLNTFGESQSGFANNHRTFTYNPVALPLATQELDYEKARQAGALFLDDKTSAISTCTRLGLEDAQGSGQYGAGMQGVVFIADCPSAGSAFGLQVGTGGTADPEAFKNFRLKNGWKVKAVAFKFTTNREVQSSLSGSLETAQSEGERHDGDEGFQILSSPVIGSDDPYTHVHVSVRPGFFLKVYLDITIEGPMNTDPYGVGPGNPCEAGYEPVSTSGGTGCVKAQDVANCGSVSTVCSSNADCLLGTICSNDPCRGKCLRGHLLR